MTAQHPWRFGLAACIAIPIFAFLTGYAWIAATTDQSWWMLGMLLDLTFATVLLAWLLRRPLTSAPAQAPVTHRLPSWIALGLLAPLRLAAVAVFLYYAALFVVVVAFCGYKGVVNSLAIVVTVAAYEIALERLVRLELKFGRAFLLGVQTVLLVMCTRAAPPCGWGEY